MVSEENGAQSKEGANVGHNREPCSIGCPDWIHNHEFFGTLKELKDILRLMSMQSTLAWGEGHGKKLEFRKGLRM